MPPVTGPAEGAVPVVAAYMLREARPPHSFGIAPINPADASRRVGQSAYRPLLVERLGQQLAYLRAAGALLAAGGLFHLTRPLRFEALPAVLAGLEAHWAEGERRGPA